MALTIADFNGLVAEHGAAMYRLAYRLVGDRHEAEDLVQDTFRSAWKSRDLFRPDRGCRAWLASILRRRAADHWRRRRPPTPVPEDQLSNVAGPPDTPGRDELTDELQRALCHLPVELRETLLVVVVGELTHQEASELLGVPLGTVLSRVSRARSRLRVLLTGSKDETEKEPIEKERT